MHRRGEHSVALSNGTVALLPVIPLCTGKSGEISRDFESVFIFLQRKRKKVMVESQFPRWYILVRKGVTFPIGMFSLALAG